MAEVERLVVGGEDEVGDHGAGEPGRTPAATGVLPRPWSQQTARPLQHDGAEGEQAEQAEQASLDEEGQVVVVQPRPTVRAPNGIFGAASGPTPTSTRD